VVNPPRTINKSPTIACRPWSSSANLTIIARRRVTFVTCCLERDGLEWVPNLDLVDSGRLKFLMNQGRGCYSVVQLNKQVAPPKKGNNKKRQIQPAASRMPENSVFFEKVVPILLIGMAVIMTLLILIAVGILVGVIPYQ
jgi:hypothetical protein